MKFLKTVLAVIVGVIIASILLFFLLVGSLSSVAASQEEVVTIKDRSVLKIELKDEVRDYVPKGVGFVEEVVASQDPAISLEKILNAIDNAKTDSRIKGISVEASNMNIGIAQLQAVRDALTDFKESGKFINAYADVYDQRNYYLSSVADKMYVNPVGAIDFKGLASEIMYYKDFEDAYGIKMEVIRHGKYKSAVEPYLANEMSAANREQISSFLKSIWNEMLEDMGKNRNKSVEELNTIANNLAIRTPQRAIDEQMIDGAIYQDEYAMMLNAAMGASEGKKIDYVTLSDYISTGKGKKSSTSSNKIAVIYAQGQIEYGKGTATVVGNEAMVKAIDKAAASNSVKAIVLRVNSPGGSALASDIIWRALERAKAQKPLVVSMGNLAASGGYYIACNANKIFAEPTTITGSIGVYGAIPNFAKAADNIGVNAERVATNSGAFCSPFEPMTKQFYDVTKEGVEDVYKTFVNRVSAGRDMTFEQVHEIAQGRVWTGKQAVENGLVDSLGSLNDAIEEAATMAQVENYRLVNYPRFKADIKDVFGGFPFMSVKEQLLKNEFGKHNYELYKKVKNDVTANGIQTKMPFTIDIK